MKKFYFLIALMLAFGTIFSASAQETQISEEKKSDLYYVSVPVEKVYPYRAGYVILYRKGVNQLSRLYLPIEWFSGTAGKADLIRLGPGKTWPYITIYYRNGEFSHLRLYVRREMAHESWGNIPFGTNLDEQFANVDDVRLY
ncbi:hypothetical protein LJC14_03820 [Treponema sp. OttesenSCG-928-L16]|nr:hypothetical protein [Treponema sp. OttesenSCG-928-L16]